MKDLKPYTQELLGILEEECAEIIQAISKMRRFGLMSYNPTDTSKTPNITHLINEIGDVKGVIEMLQDTELKDFNFNPEAFKFYSDKKKLKVPKYLRNQQ